MLLEFPLTLFTALFWNICTIKTFNEGNKKKKSGREILKANDRIYLGKSFPKSLLQTSHLLLGIIASHAWS